jgi:hypothetical protein
LIRTFHAVRTEDGRLVARWRAGHAMRYCGHHSERFVKLGKKIYFIDGNGFSELSEDDIFAGKRG